MPTFVNFRNRYTSYIFPLCVLRLWYQQNDIGLIQEYEDPNEEECIPEFSYPSYVNKHFKAKQDDVLSYKDFPRMDRPRDSTYKKPNSVVSITSVGSESTLFPLSMADVISSTLVFVMAIFAWKFIYKGSWWAIFLLATTTSLLFTIPRLLYSLFVFSSNSFV